MRLTKQIGFKRIIQSRGLYLKTVPLGLESHFLLWQAKAKDIFGGSSSKRTCTAPSNIGIFHILYRERQIIIFVVSPLREFEYCTISDATRIVELSISSTARLTMIDHCHCHVTSSWDSSVDDVSGDFTAHHKRYVSSRLTLSASSPCSQILPAIFLLLCFSTMAHAFLDGSIATCTIEGEEISIPGITDDPCINCRCTNNEVKCNQTKPSQCPGNDGCHYVLHEKPTDSCCDVCKGCFHKGREYKSGSQWTDSENNCQVHTCEAGVLTTSIKRCHVTCKNPRMVEGSCCPVCHGCEVGGRQYEEGDDFPSPLDGCTQCKCQGGETVCEKQACPVLNCADHYVYTPVGSCCPKCTGSRKLYDLQKKSCIFRQRVYSNGTKAILDECTECTCLDGTMQCNHKVCPVLDCATNEVVYDNQACCPRCQKYKKKCKIDGKRYEHGAVWQKDSCTHCYCDAGTVRCHVDQCNNMVECPANTRMQIQEGKCCPQCVDDGAICTVFGDPHYKTFDGRIYNFQGACDYILAEDCATQNISIRVKNAARLTDHYAWTKTVRIVTAGAKIYLLQKNRVKVNKKKVKLPYVHRSGLFSISMRGQSVTLKTTDGVKIIWDGDSYLEVNVPAAMKNKMCGLCGNYNNDETDDLVGRDGRLHIDPEEFGKTWVATKRKSSSCGSGLLQPDTPSAGQGSRCLTSARRRHRAETACKAFDDPLLAQCRQTVDVIPYYLACLTDMCDCPKGKSCSCESLTAYVHACEQEGLVMGNWQLNTGCGVPDCPKGAVWSQCANPCTRTCDNLRRFDASDICNKPCESGCVCPEGKVLHGDKCIRPSRCPVENTKTRKAEEKARRRKPKRTNGKKQKRGSQRSALLGGFSLT